jgi:hypothetical protein
MRSAVGVFMPIASSGGASTASTPRIPRAAIYSRGSSARSPSPPTSFGVAVFTLLEHAVMEDAKTMIATPPQVTDEQSVRLLEQVDAPTMVELTAVIGFERHEHEDQRGTRERVPGVLQGVHTATGAARGGLGPPA